MLPCPKCYGTGRIPDNTALGKSMRLKREVAGISLRSLARLLGISAPYLSDLERGRREWNSVRTNAYFNALEQARANRKNQIKSD